MAPDSWVTVFCFYPRARVGRDRKIADSCYYVAKFLSTRPRGARQPRRESLTGQDRVSIHAPAWGATHHHGDVCDLLSVSIHAPAWGATLLIGASEPMMSVSIHAPAWGATDHLVSAGAK